jgi:hypothetical protein
VTSRAPSARAQIANLAEREASNVARDEITKKGLEQGYVLPPSQVRPSGLNKTIESIGGKAATRQEAEIRNQEVTNRLAKEQIGLKPNEPLTEGALEKLRNNFAAPYREVAAIPEFKSANVMLGRVDPITNQPIAQTVNPKQILEDLKTTRADANAYYKAYSRDAHPETKAKADQLKNQANQLELQLEKIAVLSNKPDLVNQLREARKKIAQTYTVEQALNVGTTNVDARAIGRAIDRGVPLTENLRLIGNFAEQNPLYVRESSNVSTPGVSALDATVAGMSVAAGKPLAGGIILAKGPARALALSKWYQNWNAKPDYSPSAIAKALQGLTPTERNFALTRMAQLRLQKDDVGQQ